MDLQVAVRTGSCFFALLWFFYFIISPAEAAARSCMTTQLYVRLGKSSMQRQSRGTLVCLILPLVCSVGKASGCALHLSSSKLDEKSQEVAASPSSSAAPDFIVRMWQIWCRFITSGWGETWRRCVFSSSHSSHTPEPPTVLSLQPDRNVPRRRDQLETVTSNSSQNTLRPPF